MAQTRLDFQSFHWLDISNPTPESLNEVAQKYELHPTSVQDCLQPEHLPKFEMIEDVGFVVFRAYDVECHAEADTVQELTRKIAVFYGDRFVITIHRKDQPFLESLMNKWRKRPHNDPEITPEHVLSDVIQEVVRSYEKPVFDCLDGLEAMEMAIFGAGTGNNNAVHTHKKFRLQNGYYLKRRVSVVKRMLRATLEPLNRIMQNAESILIPHFQNSKEQIDQLFFYTDETSESISSLLNLHISLEGQKTNEASHRTNEVMRVLTIFSCFFLPINFIAGIYGMNFKYMPELEWPYGYEFALGLMAAVVIMIFWWFRRKGWLKRSAFRA